MSDQEKNIKTQIEKSFQKLLEDSKTDPRLKDEVFNTLAKIEGAATIIDLFTSKFIKTEGAIIENLNSPTTDLPRDTE